MYWYEKNVQGNSLVLSTRVRFARNLEDTPFPAKLGREERERVFSRVKAAYEEKGVMAVSYGDVDDLVKQAYVQTHLASMELANQGAGSGLLLSRDGEVSIMVNEEDHLRLQVIGAGKQVEAVFEKAREWITFGEEKLVFARREKLGYLTRCPTNLGAGMRLSVMIHLPALVATGSMSRMIQSLNDAGFTVRGLFGEGSREGGDLYQISNQMSREKTPEQIVGDFSRVLEQVEQREESARKALIEKDRLFWEDKVSRAVGLLRYAKKMSYQELIGLISCIRFGREAGFDGVAGSECLDRLLIELMPAPMLLRDRSLAQEEARDRRRCEIIREYWK